MSEEIPNTGNYRITAEVLIGACQVPSFPQQRSFDWCEVPSFTQQRGFDEFVNLL